MSDVEGSATALTPGSLALRRALRHAGLIAGAAVLLAAVLVALAAPLIAPHDPLAQSLTARLLPPAWHPGGSHEHLLGTDGLGRDYLSRLIYGTRVSLTVGIATMLLAGIIGTTIGFIGGYFGGWTDELVMYLVNTRLSMPGLLVALAVIALVGGSLTTIILVLGLLFWDRYAVVVRTTTQQLRDSDFVNAARAAGASAPWIIWNEVRANVTHAILVVATLEMALAVLAEASLSFLGLGIRAPTPSWGLMIAEGRNFSFYKPYLVWIPGSAIFLLVLAINLVGDGLRDVTAPEGAAVTPLLAIENLRLDIPLPAGTLHAIRSASLAIAPGETFSVVGESGCGKSLTALSILGLLPRRARLAVDRLEFDGRDLRAMRPRERAGLRGAGLAMIFQEPMTALNPVFTIGNQLAEVYVRHGLGDWRAGEQRAAELLERVGVLPAARRLRQYPHEMSGGIRQRVMIAMALMCRPKLLLADEPTTALDVTTQVEILALLKELQRDLGMALLLITHDFGIVAHLADRVAVMYAGEIVETGSTASVLARPSHPYTAALLRCLPTAGSRHVPLVPIPGVVPALFGDLAGCAFRNRCAFAEPGCAGAIPWQEAGSGHAYLCRLPPGHPGTIGAGRAH